MSTDKTPAQLAAEEYTKNWPTNNTGRILAIEAFLAGVEWESKRMARRVALLEKVAEAAVEVGCPCKDFGCGCDLQHTLKELKATETK